MTQRIKIKRSNSATNPANLKEGELAYIHSNNTSGNLYIGRPGTGDANTGIASSIDVIGGLIDHDKLDGIEANADVTDTDSVTAAGALMDSEVTNLAQVKAFDSSDYATSAQGTSATTAEGWGNHADASYLTASDITGKADLSGADFTGAVGIADGERLNFGTSSDLTLYHDDDTGSSFIKETGTGSFAIQGNNLVLSDTDASKYLFGISGGATRIYYNGGTKLATNDTGVGVTGNVTATGTLATGGFTLASTDGTEGQALVTDGSGNVAFGDVTVDVTGKADVSGDTFTGDVLFNDGVKAKFGTNSDLSIYHNDGEPSIIEDAGELGLVLKTNGNIFAVASDTDETMITAVPNGGVSLFYDNSPKLTLTGDAVNISEKLSVSDDMEVTGYADIDGTVALGAAAVAEVIGGGTAENPDVAAIPAKNTTVRGDLAVDGDLTVSGTTTTINTETINLADNIIELNSNLGANNATQDAGLEVNRGNYTNVKLFWDETNHDWRVDAVGDVATAATTSPLLTAENFETKITEIDGGTFS